MTDPYELLRRQLVDAARRRADEPSPVPARAWWRGLGRPRPLTVVVAALVICGSATAAVLSLHARPSQPLTGTVPGRAVGTGSGASPSVAGDNYRITVSPDLAAGGAGWATGTAFSRNGQVSSGDQAGGLYPTSRDPVFGGTGVDLVPAAPRTGASVAFTLTGPGVAAIRFQRRTIRTFTSPQLPTGDRAAVFFLPAGAPAPVIRGTAPPITGNAIQVPTGPGGRTRRIPAAALVPLTAGGKEIPVTPIIQSSFPAIRFWQAPSAVTSNIHEPAYHGPTRPAAGVCELGEHGLPGLVPEWGHTLSRLTAVKDAQGELLLSCIDTHYYLHGWPLTAAILLNARNPGAPPGPLPGARPVAGSAGTVDLPAAALSGRRTGNSWIVVSGGSGTAQRLRVLSALHIIRRALGG